MWNAGSRSHSLDHNVGQALAVSIPDFIRDGETGFIMENNSPGCIAENIVRALNHPDIEAIANNARALVEREFTYEAAVERYRRILGELAA